MKSIDWAIQILKQEIMQWKEPIVGVVANQTRDPFQVLISCVLSLRTKDETTAGASERSRLPLKPWGGCEIQKLKKPFILSGFTEPRPKA
jgi:hypothetical protein